ncbi:hypothetical protein RSAG8_00769, partial [Rhizoctonia solani AG-8 WAC10335]
MEDMFQDVKVLEIEGITGRSSDADETAVWEKKSKASLGALRRRVDTGPMTHVARCTTATSAWSILTNPYQYQSLGVEATNMPRNQCTSLRIAEGDDHDIFMKELCKVFNELNIALSASTRHSMSEYDLCVARRSRRRRTTET